LGLTLDYGPFQFLDAYRPGHICNHSDHQGRYAFNKQPNIAYWNLYCLGQALLPLIGEQALAIAALESFKTVYPQAFENLMRAKLGLLGADAQTAPADLAAGRGLVEDILKLLAQDAVDYTIFWRRLSHFVANDEPQPVRDLFLNAEKIEAWLLRYSELLKRSSHAIAADLMFKTNPKFVLRNHLGEQAIQAAQRKDFSQVQVLLNLLESPYDEHPGFEAFAGFPPAWASSIEISCSS
jgi:uncharacterized protein YdiU (UPF0061 family)